MKVLLISYELHSINKNYEGITAVIRTAMSSRQLQHGVWLVLTKKSTKEWREKLTQHIELGDDLLFICDITNSQKSGWHYNKTWLWLKEQINICNNTNNECQETKTFHSRPITRRQT